MRLTKSRHHGFLQSQTAAEAHSGTEAARVAAAGQALHQEDPPRHKQPRAALQTARGLSSFWAIPDGRLTGEEAEGCWSEVLPRGLEKGWMHLEELGRT